MIKPDKFGHCVKCHKNMLIMEVIDGKEQQRFLPDYVEAEFMLNDGSKMRVAMCERCKSNLTDNDNEYIMECVIKGWELEVRGFPHWNEDKKKNYLDRYGKLEIVASSENIGVDVLKRKLDSFKPKKKDK